MYILYYWEIDPLGDRFIYRQRGGAHCYKLFYISMINHWGGVRAYMK